MNKKELLEKRNAFMEGNKRLIGGLVVFFNDDPAGWMNELRSPESWEPGCIAVDADGRCWKACGGNAYDGATYWNVMPEDQGAQFISEPLINNMSTEEIRSAMNQQLSYMTLQALALRLLEIIDKMKGGAA
mgnify:CR=1 FL=1